MSVVVVAADDLKRLVEDAVGRALDARASTSTEPSAEWLDAAHVAKILGVHARTVTSLAVRGELRASRIGKLWRFQRRDVDTFLAGYRTP